MSSNTSTSTVSPMTDSSPSEASSEEVSVRPMPTTCDECGQSVAKHGAIRGEWVCTACGLIHHVDDLDRTVRMSRTSDGETNQQRGPPTDGAYARKGLGCRLPRPRREDNLSRTPVTVERDGAVVSQAPFSQYQRAQRLYECSKRGKQQGKGQGKRKGLSEVRRLSGCLELPRHVRNGAGTLFRQASRADLLRGHNIDAIAAGAVFVGAYVGQAPRPYEVVAKHAHCDVEAIRKAHQHLVSNLAVNQFEPAAADLVEWYAQKLASGLSDEVGGDPTVRLTSTAKRLLDAGGDATAFRNRAARTRTAAALYLAGQRLEYGLSQQAVADVVGISVDSVRNAYPPLAEATAGIHYSKNAV